VSSTTKPANANGSGCVVRVSGTLYSRHYSFILPHPQRLPYSAQCTYLRRNFQGRGAWTSPPWRGVDEVDGVGSLLKSTHPYGPLSRVDAMALLDYQQRD